MKTGGDVAGWRLDDVARVIFARVLDACDVETAFRRTVGTRPGALSIDGDSVLLDRFDEIRVAAMGKAADAMMRAASRVLDEAGFSDKLRRGVIVAHTPGVESSVPWAERLVGGHPLPSESSFVAGKKVLALFDGCTPRTLALFLLSGGGSALAESPLDVRLTVRDLANLNDALVRSSLPIRSINAVRKHLSAIKGGRLAVHAALAEQVTLLISDVVPGDLQSVASGPTMPDDTTITDVVEALDCSGLRERLPEAVRRALLPDALVETPKPADFASIRHREAVVMDASIAAREAASLAHAFADRVAVLDDADGLLEDTIDRHLIELDALLDAVDGGAMCAVVSAGEVTLDVTGAGLGGRNQHSALYALSRMARLCPRARHFALLSGGTDGRDGPTDAAGAVASTGMLERAQSLNLNPQEFLSNHDAYNFFDPLGGLIRTGPTGTNVRDIRIFVACG